MKDAAHRLWPGISIVVVISAFAFLLARVPALAAFGATVASASTAAATSNAYNAGVDPERLIEALIDAFIRELRLGEHPLHMQAIVFEAA